MLEFEINAIPKCKWCTMASESLESKGLVHTYNIRPKEWFKERGLTTAPQIFVRDTTDGFALWYHIGGYDDLVSWFGQHEAHRHQPVLRGVCHGAPHRDAEAGEEGQAATEGVGG